MLGLARGFDSGMEPPFREFPMEMTSPRDYVRNLARASGQATAPTREAPADDGRAELR
jgi:hypothetical protein